MSSFTDNKFNNFVSSVVSSLERMQTGSSRDEKCPAHTSAGEYYQDWLYAIIFKLYSA